MPGRVCRCASVKHLLPSSKLHPPRFESPRLLTFSPGKLRFKVAWLRGTLARSRDRAWQAFSKEGPATRPWRLRLLVTFGLERAQLRLEYLISHKLDDSISPAQAMRLSADDFAARFPGFDSWCSGRAAR